jgi:hydrogenase 3 maturation protease
MANSVIFTVGNSLMGDDAAGPRLAGMLMENPAEGWEIIDGGSAPENEVQRVRALRPDLVLVVDAAEMGLKPGEIRLVDESIVAGHCFMTTHTLPLTFLIEALRNFASDVRLLAIQPSLVAFGFPVSPEVGGAVALIHQRLTEGANLDAYERLTLPSA